MLRQLKPSREPSREPTRSNASVTNFKLLDTLACYSLRESGDYITLHYIKLLDIARLCAAEGVMSGLGNS
jgi:hypothetical protein